MYQIQLRNRSNGNCFYFREFKKDGCACSVMYYRRHLAMNFPNIYAATQVVKNIDSSKWRAVIVSEYSPKYRYRSKSSGKKSVDNK